MKNFNINELSTESRIAAIEDWRTFLVETFIEEENASVEEVIEYRESLEDGIVVNIIKESNVRFDEYGKTIVE